MDNSNPNNNYNLSIRQQLAPAHKIYTRRLWYVYWAGVVTIGLFFLFLSFQLPSFEQLENPRSRVASDIYSADGELMGKYYIENRSPLPYDSISPYLVQALVSTEDERFYQHSGIDPWALGRVAVKTILLSNKSAGGGSTISQQLAKLLVGRPNTKGRWFPVRYWLLFTTKFKEWLTAVKLERSYTKEEIIALYFNEFDFLYGACGVKSAADIYFGKLPKDLSINESAMLVRLLQNPSLHNPRRNMESAMKGREQVLFNMKDAKHITEAQYHELRVKPIDISKFKVKDHNEGIGTHFREFLREHIAGILSKPMANGKTYDLYRDGLKIYTTIDAKMQRLAEKAAWAHLSEHQTKMFKEWPDWNKDDSQKSPWYYQPKGVRNDQIDLRVRTLERLIMESERFKFLREDMIPTAVQLQIKDSDILRLQAIDRANKRSKNGTDSLLAAWFKTGEVSNEQAEKYRRLIGSTDWANIKKEYQTVLEEMKKPVKMKVFAYNSKKEKDTTMSPLDSIRYHRMFLQTGSIAVDPINGWVRSWVGGIDHKYFKYDHVNKRARRQVGSSIKPFLYSLAVSQRNYSSCQTVHDIQTTIRAGEGKFGLSRDWTPKNAGGGYSGASITLTQALVKSLNSVSAGLMKDMGNTQDFRNFLAGAGIDTNGITQSPTICLGSADLSVFEMAGGYSMFANGGYYITPIFIDRIEDKNGNVIYEGAAHQDQEDILGEQNAFVMNEMLQDVQRSAGGFGGIKSKHGGKTGTTNFQADGWYMGFTPTLVIGTWVGCDDRFIRFRGLGNGAGAKMARPIYQNYLRYLETSPETGYDFTASFPRPLKLEREQECGKFKSMNFGDDDDNTIPTNDVTNDNGIIDWDD
jgi:penicillin-binding protein 1A